MYVLLYRFGAWLLTKLTVALAIVAIGLAAFGLWLYVQDHFSAEDQRQARLQELTRERDRLVNLRAEIAREVAALQTQAVEQRDRLERANKIIATLRDLENWWERWFGNKEQQAINEQRRLRMEELQAQTGARLQELVQTAAGEERRLQATSQDLAAVEQELTLLEQAESRAAHYLVAAWEETKWYLLAALLTFFFGPTLAKVIGYYLLAPLLSRGRPIRFGGAMTAMPSVGPSHVSVDAPLWPGEVLRVKEKYLQSSDEGLTRRTRFVLDWKIPLTSAACGLIELVEMRNGRAVGEQRITFSTMDNPHIELAVIAVPEGGSLILRPSYLAGVITPAHAPLKIRRRWALFRWQAWVTLQFRFFEFQGPCRLIVAGTRGVRGEQLVEQEGFTRPARRTNQEATIGFTPCLDYLPVRAETFWGYYRDMNPLFDDLFAGAGLYVVQETAAGPAAGRPGRFWSSVWGGLLKVFGL